MSSKEIVKLLRRCMFSDTLLKMAADKIEELESEITRQQGEIERLKGWENLLKAEKHSLIKTEAIKEFARRLKCGVPQETGVIRCSDIDNLIKEMVSDKE